MVPLDINRKEKPKTIGLSNIVHFQGHNSKRRWYYSGFLVTFWMPKRDKKVNYLFD
jgi:hypothetical protein